MDLRRFTKNTLCTAIFFLLCCQPVRFLNSLFSSRVILFESKSCQNAFSQGFTLPLAKNKKANTELKEQIPPLPLGEGPGGGRSLSPFMKKG